MNGLVFAVVLAASLLLFAAGVRLPVGRPGWPRWAGRLLLPAVALLAAVAANLALFRHDLHFDLTASRAFTASPELQRLARGLQRDVDLTYFFQKQDPGAKALRTVLEVVARQSPRLHVRSVDPDQHPGVASRYGVRGYNVAVIESEGRRLQVATTSEVEIALAIIRVSRSVVRTVCFTTGHAEYDIDNFEYHTHFEGSQSHSHDSHGARVVLMQQHGFGRVRRALESLGFASSRFALSAEGGVPSRCSVVVMPGPRTRHTPQEIEALVRYLASGGAALLLFDLDAPVEAELAAALGQVGLSPGDGVLLDPREHYFTDEQMVTVTDYGPHAITRGLALSFFPGARPVVVGRPPAGVTVTPLLATSPESHLRPLAASPRDTRVVGERGSRTFGAAAEGTWPGAAAGAAPFRLVLIGDADFASNSFFPYLANSDLALAAVAWLAREELAPTMKPPVEVLPRVVLTSRQVTGIFVTLVIVLPGLAALAGGILWWRRRR
ncbi:MAG: Gldg family protein [Deltaproteobacteria bacterium]|nr:Gldg family protein [Deltaproteobacteria bacterium]